MLLLVTIVLVLVAAVTLLIGIFSDQLALIFISIGASALAAIVLGVLSQMSRRKGRATATSTGPEADAGRSVSESEAVSAIGAVGVPVATTTPAPSDEPTSVVAAVPAGSASEALPIEGYDDLRVNQILPQLGDLDLDELEQVAQHEESHKNRTTVLNRIDQLMDDLEAEPGAGGSSGQADADQLVEEAVASIEEIGEPIVAVESEPEPATPPADAGFPIPDYDSLSEAELIPMLGSLDADQLETVADREEAGANRDAVLDAIDDRLDILEGVVPPPATSASAPQAIGAAAAPTAVKKAPARKASATPAKKSAAKKAPASAARKAAPSPTKKAAASTAAKVPARTAKKTPAPTAKAPAATRKAATKAAPATKKTTAVVKKATPVKKASAAKKATKR